MANNKKKNILVDSHVHLYDNFDPDSFIESISRNFKKFSRLDEAEFSDSVKMIFLTEAKDNDFFSRLQNNSLPLKNCDIRAKKTGEKSTLLLKENGNDLFYIVRGRQIITEENIEILSVGNGMRIKDGLSAEEVLERIVDNGQMAILAWGVGKWLLGRGKVVKTILKTLDYPHLVIGDNSARPSLWFKPLIYRKGDKLGIPVIAGSDPLPLDGEDKKAGSYFFMVKGLFDPEKPLGSIKKILTTDIKKIKNIGKRDSVFAFIKRQSKIMLKKYLK